MDGTDQRILTPHNLPYRLRLLVQLMARKFQDMLDPHHLTPLLWGVLSFLWQEDGLATVELAHRLEQLPGTIIAALNSRLSMRNRLTPGPVWRGPTGRTGAPR